MEGFKSDMRFINPDVYSLLEMDKHKNLKTEEFLEAVLDHLILKMDAVESGEFVKEAVERYHPKF